MFASVGDVISWALPLIVGGVVTVCGLMALLWGRFDPGSGREVRGGPAVCLGILALPALPVTWLVNPSLSQLAEWADEREAFTERVEKRRQRQEEITGLEKKLKERIAAARRNTAEGLKLQREGVELAKERSALAQEHLEDASRLQPGRRGGPGDPFPYLLPLAWGAVLYCLAWLFGRKVPAAAPDGPA
jgi:hypothetical protein